MLEDCVRKHGKDASLLDLIDPVWTGTMAYRGLIPVERLSNPNGTEHRTVRSPMMVRLLYQRDRDGSPRADACSIVLWKEQGVLLNRSH